MTTPNVEPPTSSGASQFDSVSSADGTATETIRRKPFAWNSGADFGILILRLVLGGVFIAHGAQKLFGSFGGPGVDGFAKYLESFGFTQTKLLSYVTGIAELGGGILLVLGLLTPLATAAVLGVMATNVVLKWNAGFFASSNGFELEFVLGAAAIALLFLGPGRIAADNGRTWARAPQPWAILFLIIAAAATAFTVLVLR